METNANSRGLRVLVAGGEDGGSSRWVVSGESGTNESLRHHTLHESRVREPLSLRESLF